MLLTGNEMQLAREETLADTARVMSRYVDAIMIRILDHDDLLELAGASAIPVINGLTRRAHPCQVMADIMTFEEHRGPIKGAKVAWVGDSQQRAGVLGACHRAVRQHASPSPARRNTAPTRRMLADIRSAGANVTLGEDPERGGRRTPTSSSPTPGSRWATPMPPIGARS